MSQKKHKQAAKAARAGAPATPSTSAQKKLTPEPEPHKSKAGLLLAVAAVAIVGIVVALSIGGGDSASTGAGGAPTPTAEEAPYIGRLLPAGYTAPVVAEPTTYSSTVEMTELPATLTETHVTMPLSQVAGAQIALIQYEREGQAPLPLIAYVKPSGALFVGISFCPPCQGEWQTIQGDSTLTCNACGTKRDLETQVGISGSCKLYPLDELPVTVEGDSIIIDRAAIDTWTPQPLDRQVG